jgi:ABC-2 type transport system ATP-binding protein
MNAVIQTHQLSRRFGRKEAVKNLTIEVPRGSIYAFLGPNGAGKTTTIKMLMNILASSGGTAEVLGQTAATLGREAFQRIGYVSENQKLPEWMTVRQFIAFCKPLYPAWDDAFCERLLRQFDLPLDRKLRHLSRGMKVKAALLTSLAYKPELLVLDEPFSGLDPLVRDEFIRGVLELTVESNWTVFVSSHDIDEVERLADWVGIINEGELKLSESTASLQARFRQVEVTLPTAAPPPRTLPDAWLMPEQVASTSRWVESRYDEAALPALIEQHFPGARLDRVAPMSLREIFLALARTYRLGR